MDAMLYVRHITRILDFITIIILEVSNVRHQNMDILTSLTHQINRELELDPNSLSSKFALSFRHA